MKFRICSLITLAALLNCFNAQTLAQEKIDFSRDIQPILSENCYFCHGQDANQRESDLRLDVQEDAMRTIEPGDAESSDLIARLISDDPDEIMPPPDSNRSVSPEQIELVKRWINEGGNWGQHWAYTPITKPTLPDSEDIRGTKLSNPIDLFVARKLRQNKLEFSPTADRETLIRRLSLDLTGLPPTIEEIDSFLNDESLDAYEKVVDRLLASTAYGERMAWVWLDAARYADTNGYQQDHERTMWPWRDWVIEAYNSNMPFDQFSRWQLAGDHLPNATQQQILATGFNRNHPINGEGGRIAEENRIDYVMDMAETTGTIWMGLTFNCCRCHDHKYDQLSQEDYYSLFAFFDQTPIDGSGGNARTPPVLEIPTKFQKRRKQELEKALENVRKKLELVTKSTDEDETEKLAIEEEVVSAEKKLKLINTAIPKVMVMRDKPKPRKSFRLNRGSYLEPLNEVSARVPERFEQLPKQVKPNRLALANWLFDDSNPLTARVSVNRLWDQFFGIGLVKTTEDFGVQSEPPSHPDLLDWLAADYRESAWDTKHMIRLIVTSQTYRQSSKTNANLRELDPNNRLLARGARFRMPSWMIRDHAIAASGKLVRQIGGKPVNTYQPPGVWEEASFGNKKYKLGSGDELYRRTLYTFWRRIAAPTMIFDNADRMTCSVKTYQTNTPLHALGTLNDTTYVEASRLLATVALTETQNQSEAINLVFRRVVGRKVKTDELAILKNALERTKKQFKSDQQSAQDLIAIGESKPNEDIAAVELASWTSLCLAVLNLDEALTRQ